MTPQALIMAMASMAHTDRETLLGRSRKSPLPLARYLLFSTFCGAGMNMSTTQAGRWLGRNHSTVLHGMNVVALCRQRYGSPEEHELISSWDAFTAALRTNADQEPQGTEP